MEGATLGENNLKVRWVRWVRVIGFAELLLWRMGCLILPHVLQQFGLPARERRGRQF